MCSSDLFAKSPRVYEDLKKLHAKTRHGSFVKLKTALTAARKWEPSFDKSLSLILVNTRNVSHAHTTQIS